MYSLTVVIARLCIAPCITVCVYSVCSSNNNLKSSANTSSEEAKEHHEEEIKTHGEAIAELEEQLSGTRSRRDNIKRN